MTDTGQAATPAPPVLPCDPDGRMFPEHVAAVAGVQVGTITRLNTRSKRNRKLNRVKPGDLPKPAGYRQRRHGPPSPYWWEEQIRHWMTTKPQGPGRPRKT